MLRTGTIDAIAGFIIKRAKRHPKLAVAEMFLGAFVASAFMNNTPVVIVLIPIISAPLARDRFLIQETAHPAELHLHIGRARPR